MRWRGGRRSDNIDDRRGQGPGLGVAGAAPAILRLLPLLLRNKVGRIVLLVGVVAVVGGRLLGVDVLSLFAGGAMQQPAPGAARGSGFSAAEEELAELVAVVLADTEDVWNAIFRGLGREYKEPRLVLFSGRVESACGRASAAVGPFYCPADQQLYIALSVFRDLALRHGAPGDFAQAYVIAHEVGHHVQTLLGISARARAAGSGKSRAEVNAISVAQELQADCFAGLWGYAANTRGDLLEAGDLEEALAAATAIGDDRLQREAGRDVVPDSFTHGSSAQRVRWFRSGFTAGKIDNCDTFSAHPL